MAKSTPATTLSDFEAEERRPGVKCWYTRLDDGQRKLVDDALAAGRTQAAVGRAISKHFDISVKGCQVGYHVRGDCSCGK